jgi:CheY-like chemotaxis protein
MKPTVLIADNDPELCAVYQKLIAARGYRAETASDGLECLEKLRQAMPAAVVLDLDLPWGGGQGVLAWLREEQPDAGVGVILTAPAGYPMEDPEVIEPPVVQILLKPFGLVDLLEGVRSAVAKGQAAAPRAGHEPVYSELYIG